LSFKRSYRGDERLYALSERHYRSSERGYRKSVAENVKSERGYALPVRAYSMSERAYRRIAPLDPPFVVRRSPSVDENARDDSVTVSERKAALHEEPVGSLVEKAWLHTLHHVQ
jgi:hypothetical protein